MPTDLNAIKLDLDAVLNATSRDEAKAALATAIQNAIKSATVTTVVPSVPGTYSGTVS